MVQFSRINANQAPIELLLEADPDEGMIHRYLEGAYCFVGHTNHKIIAACIVKPIDSATAEIFNISVHPEHQNKGIGSKLLNYVIKQISHENITRLVLGTGTFGHQLSYYQRAGFRVDSVIKDHFLKHYKLPIFENGIQHKDMLRLYLDLPTKRSMFTLTIDDNLTLALVEPSFAPLYLQIISKQRDYLSQWLAWPPHAHDEAFFLSFVERSLGEYADGKSMVCAMVYQGQVVGNVSFNKINQQLKRVEIGYWLDADYQGKGIVSQSVAKLTEFAFTELAMEKVQISAATGNQPSRNVCERLGFKLEGIITRNENLNGRVVDHAIYGLSRESWQMGS